MTSYLSPGVYTRETDFSFYVKQISASACGMVGIAEKGTINKPTLVTSWEQFVRKFGSYIVDGYLAYAARAFFDNGGQVLYVNRIAHYSSATNKTSLTAKSSSVTLKGSKSVTATLDTGSVGVNRINWRAKTPGVEGNQITITCVATGISTPLSVDVAGQAITVHLTTNASGNSICTAPQVVSAINAHVGASALVVAATTETGLATTVVTTHLTGGMALQDIVEVSAVNEGTWAANFSPCACN